jgi:hypothetical protein
VKAIVVSARRGHEPSPDYFHKLFQNRTAYARTPIRDREGRLVDQRLAWPWVSDPETMPTVPTCVRRGYEGLSANMMRT